MDFAQWLQSEMDKNGLTEYRIAKLSGVHQTTIKNLLLGAKPQMATEDKIRKAIKKISEKQKEIPPTEKVDGMEEELIRTLCKTGYTHCALAQIKFHVKSCVKFALRFCLTTWQTATA